MLPRLYVGCRFAVGNVAQKAFDIEPLDFANTLFAKQRLNVALDTAPVGCQRRSLFAFASFREIFVAEVRDHHFSAFFGTIPRNILAKFGLRQNLRCLVARLLHGQLAISANRHLAHWTVASADAVLRNERFGAARAHPAPEPRQLPTPCYIVADARF